MAEATVMVFVAVVAVMVVVMVVGLAVMVVVVRDHLQFCFKFDSLYRVV